MSRPFISYTSNDKRRARKLATHLRHLGCDPWLDEFKIGPGQDIVSAIEDGISKADFLVVLLTRDSVRSGWVEREWKTKYWDEVQAGRVAVIPLLFEDCEIPLLLRGKRYIDFRTDYALGLARLSKALFSESQQTENKFLLKREEFPLDLLRLATKYEGCHLRVLSHTGESLQQFMNPIQSWFRSIESMTLVTRNPAIEFIDEKEWNGKMQYEIPWRKHEVMARLHFHHFKLAEHAGLSMRRYFYNHSPFCTMYLFGNRAAFFSVYRHNASAEKPRTVFGREGGCPWKSWYFPFMVIEGAGPMERLHIENMIEYFDAHVRECIGFDEMAREYQRVLVENGEDMLWERLTTTSS